MFFVCQKKDLKNYSSRHRELSSILAIQLFNEQGTTVVSTNHIASAIGISPCNLYYHFRNKEDIIRAIFEQMDAYGFEQYHVILDNYQPGTIEAIEQKIFRTVLQPYVVGKFA
jgi:AcrR family transcriptional regulator